jgi:uncharacterized SAM-binding protein YcdF (DUF218 family)
MDFFLPNPVHLLVLLLVLAAFACFSRGTSNWLRAVLVALASWCWVFTTPALANLVFIALEGPPSRAAVHARDEKALIVVLPSGRLFSRSGKPSPLLDANGWERLDCAIRLWHELGGTLLLNGGPGGDPETSLAGIMRRVALQSGVPDAAIRISPGSLTTYEDLSLSREVIAKHDGPRFLVTSALHMPRALAVSRKLGLTLAPYPCAFRQIEDPTWFAWVPNAGGSDLWSDALHEVVGRQYYRLRGWAD